MRSIVIASNSSGGGKTTLTLGLMKALMNRGYKVQGYKVGPDYIDPAYHSHITKQTSRNLDLFLMGESGVKYSYSRGCGDLGVVEGVMGFYDGRGITTDYSTAHLSRVLGISTILVISPKAQSSTLCAEINGILNYEKNKIVGVILNNISESYYALLKAAIEKNCKLKVFGYVPKNEKLSLKSRHLGLIQSSEIEDLDEKIELCSKLMEEYVDLEALIDNFKEAEHLKNHEEQDVREFHMNLSSLRKIGRKIAVAYDKAFSFYYKDNIELLEKIGEVVYFSPLMDKELPKDIDFLYLGGGYPEVFSKELCENTTMLESIKNALNNGLGCYAECGGLMYLTESIDHNKMVGFLNLKSSMTTRLRNFGYAEIEVTSENPIIGRGNKINCHEFHKSFVESTISGENLPIYTVTKEMYDGTEKKWNCGYVKNNTLAAYAHINFLGNLEFFKGIFT